MAAKKNPLSHLGWLGLLGVAGIFIGAPMLLVFLLFFFFFTYRKMPADELFWANVRKAAARTFAVYIGYDIAAILVIVPRAMFVVTPASIDHWPPVMEQGMYLVTESLYTQINLIAGFFIWGIIINLCVFFFTLMRIHRKEKKYLEAANAGN